MVMDTSSAPADSGTQVAAPSFDPVATLEQYEREFREELQTPTEQTETPTEPAVPPASETEPGAAAPDAGTTDISTPDEEDPQQRERRFQSEADRVVGLFKAGRQNELTATELAKAREIAGFVTQTQPDIAAPIAQQGYQQGRKEAEEWSRVAAWHQEVSTIEGSMRRGEVDVEDAEQRLRTLGFDNIGHAFAWKQQAEAEYQKQQQKANQPDPTPFLEEGYRHGVVTAGDAFMAAFRDSEAGQGLSDQEWVKAVDEARTTDGFPGVVKMIERRIHEHVEKQARSLVTQASQQAKEQAQTDFLTQLPAPTFGGGSSGGAEYSSYGALAAAYADGAIDANTFTRHPLRKQFESR